MRKEIFLLPFILIIFSLNNSISAEKGGFGFVILQASFKDNSAINSALEGKGFPTINRSLCADIGGGGYFVIGKSKVIGLRGGSVCGFGSSNTDRYKVSAGGGYFITSFGLLKSMDKNFILGDLGIGFAGLTVDVKDKTSKNGDFYTHYIAETLGIMGELSFLLGRWIKEGFFVGIQGGIMYPLFGFDIEGRKIPGIYSIRILIGGGAF